MSDLFSGDTGAGKSTILDAIQLILTTNTRFFNLAANTESKRTLKTYVRGKTGEEGNEYIRKGAVISYVALEVYEEAKNNYFVIGAKFDSPDLESDIRKKWFLVEGCMDELSFIIDNKPSPDNKFCINGNKVSFIHQSGDAQQKFLYRLGLGTQTDFADLLSRSLAFKPMKNVKDFVSRYILPERNIDVDLLRENIRELSQMQLVVETVKEQVASLEKIKTKYNDILNLDRQILVTDLLILLAKSQAMQDDLNIKSNKIKENGQTIDQLKNKEGLLDAEIGSLNGRRIEILSSLNSGRTAQLISSIKADIKVINSRITSYQRDVDQLDNQLSRLDTAKKYISSYIDIDTMPPLRDHDVDIQVKNSFLIKAEDGYSKAKITLNDKRSKLSASRSRLDELKKKLTIEIKDLEQNKMTYDSNVTALKVAIEREFSARGIDSSVYILADLLEIVDKTWQNAVEAYLNTQKFHIFVEPQYYDIAVEVYDRNKAKIHTAGIVNTGKLKTDYETLPDRLSSVVSSENRYAMAYVHYLLDRVVMCDSVLTLKEHEIAITKECMLYQGKVLRNLSPQSYKMPYIGKHALLKQLEIKKAERERYREELSSIQNSIDFTETALTAIERCNFEILHTVLEAPSLLYHAKQDLSELEADLEKAENDPTYLQLKIEAEKLENDIKAVKEKLDKTKENITKITMQSQDLAEKVQKLQADMNDISRSIDDLSIDNEDTLYEAKKKFAEQIRIKSASAIADNYGPRRQTLLNQRDSQLSNLISMQARYKDGEYGTGCDMMQTYFDEYTSLVKHDLISYEEKLRTIKENCETEFRENFLAKMRENIESAISYFKELNKILKTIPYGNDVYQFSYDPNKNKKRLYEMIKSEFNVEGFTLFSEQFDKEYHDEMEELFNKLTSSEENGDDVIHEYADYRSYMDYDIDINRNGKVQKFSRVYGEKSGGETQTPYYVAIAASLVRKYKIGETIRIIMLDEAFDKMDNEHIESMMTFFKTQDLQVVLAAPTTRLELIGEYVDSIILVETDNDHNSITEEYSYEQL